MSEEQLNHQNRLLLYGTVTISGAAVMMLELLGTRIIGPFYGVSLYVWSSLISVALIALALGYYLGGLVADKQTRFRLSYAIALAGLTTAVIPLVSRPILLWTNDLGLRAGAFTSALLLFALPLTCLGMVGPQVIALAARRQAGVGMAAGSVFAVSTVGSVVGTLLLGFFLLPALGSRVILYGVSAALILLAIVVALYERRWSRAGLGPVAAAAIATGAGLWLQPNLGPTEHGDYRLVHQAESHYGWVRVVDDRARRVRWMLSDASVISALRLDTRGPVLSYQKIIAALPHLHPEGRNALLIGLGGGYIAMAFAAQGIEPDAFVLYPEVAKAAQQYFLYEPSGALLVGDARYEIRRLDQQYDFIVHDCFTGGSVPSHLLSVEMLHDLDRLLKDDGLLALNFVGFTEGPEADAAAAVYRTLGEVYPHRLALVSLPGETFNDFVFLVSRQPISLESEDAAWLAAHKYSMPAEGDLITDDFNPLERLQVAKAERYRALLLERMGPMLLAF
ncbi:MAG: SAM-dependent methyltransferase [Gemmatimonadetes bacterium]|nr:SAM-dependent methyltransferase [Gemmatimonadota bacterium]